MKPIYIKLLIVTVIIVISGMAGCKKFLDVNESPNGPESVQESLVLPSTQAGIGMVLGNNLEVFGSMWAQYWTQNTASSQYKSIDQYQPLPTSFDRMWGILYSTTLEDIEFLISKADQEKYKQYAAIGFLEKAYTFQLLTDAFGDVPLKDAFKGTSNLFPRYDSQKEVYDSILTWTKKGIDLANNSSSYKPGKEDLLFNGNMNLWKSFGNTLLLRANMRLSEIEPDKAKAGIVALYATSPKFLMTDAKIIYSSVGGNQNPLYAESVGLGNVQNLIASQTAVDKLKANNDQRIFYFYLTRYSSGNIDSVYGNPQGQYDIQPPPKMLPAYPSTNTGGRAGESRAATSGVAPVIFISASESYFLQAEAAARGWTTDNATTLLKAGITASFTACGIAASAPAYIANAPDAQMPPDRDGQIKTIITQKYYAMCGIQGFEAWTEWRRTGYPGFFVVSKASSIGGTNMPQRFLYPNTEITRNTNFPGQKLITDRVWWDVK